MGGKVLEHEAKTILREGWKQGREKGRREGEGYGRMEQAKETGERNSLQSANNRARRRNYC